LLCECDEPERAALIREVLKEAGIESWIQGPGYSVAPDMSSPSILVAADQLEQAREIVARPIPQSIIEQFQMQIPEFEPPVCPGCGAEDPLLESVDPRNTWLCESCGKQWTDPEEDPNDCSAGHKVNTQCFCEYVSRFRARPSAPADASCRRPLPTAQW
jgi:transposase-like protein